MDLIRKLRETGRPVVREDGSVDLEGIDFSAADTWLRCGEQYRRRYVEGKRSPPGIALVEGTSHHAAMEEDNLSKRDKGKQLPAKALTEVFASRLDAETEKAKGECEAAKSAFDWEGEDRNRLMNRAKLLHVDYAGKWSQKFEPVYVEHSFTRQVELDGKSFTAYGQIDLGTKSHILDYKTANRAKSERDVQQNLQLTLYSWAFNIKKVGIIAFVKTKDPYVQYVESERTPGQWVWGMKVLAYAVESIRRGVFPLTNPGAIPAPWHCSPRFCGYWGDCRGRFDPQPEGEKPEA